MEVLFFFIGLIFIVLLLVHVVLAVKMATLRRRIDALENRVNALVEAKTVSPQPEKAEKPQLRIAVDNTRTSESRSSQPEMLRSVLVQPDSQSPILPHLSSPFRPQDTVSDEKNIFGHIRDFFTRGNPVVRIGMVILFFGVGFLLKYAAEHQMFPIELRLAAVAIGGIVMLIIGWRLREHKKGYALILQGGAVGILYLDLFAASKLYHLIPMGLAFFLMAGLVVLSGILAVLQDAQGLAAFGAAGGFLAPILTSEGGGSHIMLFSYYAMLNSGILGIAWFKSWRPLNLVGAFFTFAIGTIWGSRYYQPAYFYSTEPFLIFFFLIYVAVSVLFAHRQPPKLKGFIDGSLVFGVPIIAFALQGALVKKYEYGLAISALSLSAFYIGLAGFLWRRQIEGLRMLIETFLALGVVFGSLAIPLALDGRWTAAAWALEGAAMVWIGVRQDRCLARCFGILLQIGASLAFLNISHASDRNIPIFNGFYLGCLIIAFAALFSSFYSDRHKDKLREWEMIFPIPMMIWGLLWWFGAGFAEIDKHVPHSYQAQAMLLLISLSSLCMGEFSRILQWKAISYPQWLLLPCMTIYALVSAADHPDSHPFVRIGSIAWIAAYFSQYRFLWQNRENRSTQLTIWHLGSLWLMIFLLTAEGAWAIKELVRGAGTWEFIAWGVCPAVFAAIFLTKGKNIRWPLGANLSDYLDKGIMAIWFWLLLWGIRACFKQGEPWPLPYFPILNQVGIAQIFAWIVMIRSVWQFLKKRFVT